MDSFKSLPPPGYRYKVYIIDEVHMLSVSAFNALLKSLEEPPPNTVFILATTEVHKIPETVISRCQRHDFRALSAAVIEARLQEICAREQVDADAESLKVVARLADGSMRDAQTLLDRVISFCSGPIRAEETSVALGTVEARALRDLAHAIVQRNVPEVLRITADLFSTGIDPAILLKEFVNFWREAFVARLGGEGRLQALGVGADSIVELSRLVSSLEPVDIQDLWDFAREGADRCHRSSYPRYGFEALVVRMATRQPVAEIGELVGKLLAGAGGEESRNKGSAPISSRSGVAAPLRGPAREAVSSSGVVAGSDGARQDSQPPARADSVESAGVSALPWEDFLRFVVEGTGKVLVENLKRLKLLRFESGLIEATGPDFTVTSLQQDKERIGEICKAFVQARGGVAPKVWNLSFAKGPGAFDPAVEAAKAKATEESLQAHPAVQSLQKIFPGSKVEQMRVKSS
jgi:DNA polymerase III subunit gamma/tau